MSLRAWGRSSRKPGEMSWWASWLVHVRLGYCGRPPSMGLLRRVRTCLVSSVWESQERDTGERDKRTVHKKRVATGVPRYHRKRFACNGLRFVLA